MLLLDTNVVAELRRHGTARADAHFQAWTDRTDLDHCFLSVITIMEIERGVIGKERKDPDQGRVLRRWFEAKVLGEFERRILPLELSDARTCAAMHVPHLRPENDTLLASVAKRTGMTVVTRNIKDFAGLDVACLNPWQRIE